MLWVFTGVSGIDPDNPDWILELSCSNNNLAAVQLASGRGINEETLAHVDEATRLMEMVVALKPDDEAVATDDATTLAWAADAQYQACNLEEDMALRSRVLELSDFANRKAPANNDFKVQFAYALTGVARAQRVIGKPDLAKQNLEKEYGNFLLVYADAESQMGQVESAKSYLQKFISLQSDQSDQQARDIYDIQRLVLASYLWWQLNGKDNLDRFPVPTGFSQASTGEFRSCVEADSAARMFMIDVDRESAITEVAYLRDRGYADPHFIPVL